MYPREPKGCGLSLQSNPSKHTEELELALSMEYGVRRGGHGGGVMGYGGGGVMVAMGEGHGVWKGRGHGEWL